MAQRLIQAWLNGGDVDRIDYTKTLWTDFQRGMEGSERWNALVADVASAKDLAALTGAALLHTEYWDGAPFGDGSIGTVESQEVGKMVCQHSEFCGALPDGWDLVTE